MSFLVGLAAQLVEWLISQLASMGINFIKKEEQKAADSAQSQKDETAVEGAKTDEDRASAISGIAHHTFGPNDSSK